ncbi:MAG: hypothetical protein COB85_07665 [Bacteroidetes bacterium]|nr:MAG: hypothetical protein COB85_07665 [Bacteroidota bacterium]
MLFYSSYGKLGTSKDIYLVKKRSNGDWGTPEILSIVINTDYDEEYPVMYPNSNILYFCSKGHNSMGGYDIFKSAYDSSSGTWSKPTNLEFAINSADDDILYLTTPDELTAYFSSKRSSILGKINVYKVRLKERPGEAPIVASTAEIISKETGELENIEEIQALAQLDVNATEEEFNEPTSVTSKTQTTEEPIEAETFTNLSNEDLIKAGNNYVQKIKQDQVKLSKEAEVSFAVASDKKENSQEKLTEAETILARVENISDPGQKQLALQTAENLKEEAKQLERQSEIAFEMSKSLAIDADIKQKELTTAENNATRIEAAVRSNQLDESISLLIEQKVLANSGTSEKIGVEEMTRKMKQDADIKESLASESYEKIQFMENEIAEINDEIVNLNEQAESTKDPTIKEEILRQAEELDGEMKDTETELQKTYADAKVFEQESKALKVEAELFTAVSSEVMKTSSEQISDLGEPLAVNDIADESASPESEIQVEQRSTEAEVVKEEPAPLVSIVAAEETTTQTGLESNEDNLSEEDLAKYDINEETVNKALTDSEVEAEVEKVEKLQKEAENYTSEATAIRDKAETIENAEFKQNAIKEAEKFEEAAAQKESEAATGQSSINYYEFQQNVNAFDEYASNNAYLTADDVTEVNTQKQKSAALFEESKASRTKARTIEDADEKAAELDKARNLESQAISVQREGLNQLAAKENNAKLQEKKKMDSQITDSDLAIINKLESEADELYAESNKIRFEANNISDPEVKLTELNRATALEKQAIQKQRNALNNYEFQDNLSKLAAASGSGEQLSPTQMSRLEILQEEFNDLLKQSIKARVDADDTASVIASAELLEKAVDLEELAIQKQFEVMSMYGIETPEPLVESTSSSSEELALSTAPESAGTENDEVTSTSTTQDAIQGTNTAEESKTSSERGEMIEAEDTRSAMELIAASEAQKAEAKQLYDQIEVIDDPIILMETLDKAEELEKQAERNMALAIKKQEEEPAEEISRSEELASASEEISDDSQSTLESETPATTTSSEPTSEIDETNSSEIASITEGSSKVGEDSEIPEEVISQLMDEEEEELAAAESSNSDEEQSSESESFASTDPQPEETANEETPTNNEEPASFEATETFEEAINIETFDESAAESEPAFEASSDEGSFNAAISTPLPASSEPLTEDIFTTATTNTYNTSNPIPVNRAVPSGLIFKVQIGAFRNRIPQNLFKGISPIMGENTAMGFIRYTAGLFRKIESANKAKSVIRDYGFVDAFVVAFFNGNRVSIEEAREILGGGEAPAYALVIKTTSSGDVGTGSLSSSSGSSVASFGTNDLSSITKLLYTVQVGVYKNPTNVGEKFGLGKLNSINTSNGYIRYTYGIHDNINQANASKIIAIDNGISDAFVTAYYNGERISLTKARTLEIANESVPEATFEEPESEPAIPDNNVEEEIIEEAAPISPAVTLNPESEVFKVQIGQFSNAVPVDESIAFFSLKDLGIERHEQGELIIYTVGSFDNYKDAEELRKVVASKGVAEGSVVINRNDSIIPMEDFLKSTIDSEDSKETIPEVIIEEPEISNPEDNSVNTEIETTTTPEPSTTIEVDTKPTEEPEISSDGPLTDEEFERALQKILDDD